MDRIELNNLFSLYEELLTDKEKDIYKMYNYEDLSLQEISDNLNITRNAVHNTIKRALKEIDSLNDTEEIKKKIESLI